MRRIVAFAACAVSLGACTAGDLNVFRVEKTPLTLKLESVPPGAEAKVSANAPACKTPCEVPIDPAAGTLTVVFTLEGYHPQEVTVQVVDSPGEPARATPNPVTVELEAPPKQPPRRRPAKKRSAPKKPAPKKPAARPATQRPATARPAPAPAPAATSAGPAPASTESSPWPAPAQQQQQPQSSPWPAAPSQQKQ